VDHIWAYTSTSHYIMIQQNIKQNIAPRLCL